MALPGWKDAAGAAGTAVAGLQTQPVANNVSIVLHGITSIYSKRVLECMPRELLLAGFLRDSLMNKRAACSWKGNHCVYVPFGGRFA